MRAALVKGLSRGMVLWGSTVWLLLVSGHFGWIQCGAMVWKGYHS